MRNARKGFTLVEMIIVLVIIGILAAIAYVAYSAIQFEADKRSLRVFAQSVDHEATALGVANTPQDGARSNVRTVLNTHFGPPTTVFAVDYWGDENGNGIFVSTADGEHFTFARGLATGSSAWACYMPTSIPGRYTDESGYTDDKC